MGLLLNQSSVNQNFIPSVNILKKQLGIRFKCIFAPEHGWSGFNKEGIHIETDLDHEQQVPVFSLYGQAYISSLDNLKYLNTLVIDIQDIGVRCYTYAATCAQLIEYAAKNSLKLKFIICDRPNPLGKHRYGPCQNLSYKSLVNYHDIPFVHGLSLGTVLTQFNKTLTAPVRLEVINYLEDYNCHRHIWIPPSPGLPHWDCVHLYPGLVLLEGTSISEGRGSTLPFQVVAAPKLNPEYLIDDINSRFKSIVQARPLTFTPVSGKLKDQECSGIQLHILDHSQLKGLHLGVVILSSLRKHFNDFKWITNGNSYWIDQLTGSHDLRIAIDEARSPEDIFPMWNNV